MRIMKKLPFKFTCGQLDAATSALHLDCAMDTSERRALPLEDCGIAGVPALGMSRYRAVSPHLPEHIHPGCVEFNYCINGSLRLKKDGVLYHLNPGNIFVAKPGQRHELLKNHKGMFMYWLIVQLPNQGRSARLLGLPPKESSALANALVNLPQTIFAADRTMQSRFHRLMAAYDLDVRNRLRSLRIRSLVLETLIAIIGCGNAPVAANSFSKIKSIAEDLCRSPEKYRDTRGLAAKAGFCKVRFTQLFKQVTGLPPHAFLLQAKVMRAKKLLAKTDASVSEIARRLALSSPRHFATLFRETLGITPTAYRLSHAPTPRTFRSSQRTENTLPENRPPIVDTMFSS